MNALEQHQQFVKLQQERFPDWMVRDHGGGGHTEMMKDFISKNGEKVMVFIWNDERATIFHHPKNKNQYISLQDWNEPITSLAIWNDPNEENWVTLLYYDDDGTMKNLHEKINIFDDKTVLRLIAIFQEARELKKRWKESETSFQELKKFNKQWQKSTTSEELVTSFEEQPFQTGASELKTGDVIIVNHNTLYKVIQLDFDEAESKYGLLNMKTNKVELTCNHLYFKEGELFELDRESLVTSILKHETFEMIRNM